MSMSEKPTGTLMRRTLALHQSLYVDECFHAQDLLEYEALLNELEQRGYVSVPALKFAKIDTADEYCP